mgnify:CR=1 FL=1
MTRRQAKRRGVTDKPESPIFIRQPYESERENGFYGAFLHVSRLNPYLAYCEGGFRERSIGVSHLVLAKPGWRPSAAQPA